MNKGDLISKLAEDTTLSKAQATEALNTVLSCITDALRDGDKVALLGFGTFTKSHRPERAGRNPRTGETITISAKNNIKFKAGKELEGAVN